MGLPLLLSLACGPDTPPPAVPGLAGREAVTLALPQGLLFPLPGLSPRVTAGTLVTAATSGWHLPHGLMSP